MQHDFADSPVAQDYGEEIGAPFTVFLLNGVTEKLDTNTGKMMTEVVDLPGLIASILQSRVLHPKKLSGDDLRFIRSALHMRSTDVAAVLDVSPEHYSRCEAGTKTLSSSAEKSYRMYVFLQAMMKHVVVQQELSEGRSKDCESEEAKEALEAFRNIFLEMKIQHLAVAGEELVFAFLRESRRDDDLQIDDCGSEDGKWRKEPRTVPREQAA